MKWYVAQTKHKSEGIAVKELGQQGFECYLPILRLRRSGVLEREAAMFPGYVFVTFDVDLDRWRSINGTRGVKRLLGNNPERPCSLPEDFVDLMRNEELSGGFMKDLDVGYKVGETLRILTGPLKDCVGICQASSRKRVKILLHLLGNDLSVSLSQDNLERASLR